MIRDRPTERQVLWGVYSLMHCAERWRTNFGAGRGRLYEEVFERLQELLDGDEGGPASDYSETRKNVD